MIRVTVQHQIDATDVPHHYVMAGQRMVFQYPVDRLQKFESGAATQGFSSILQREAEPTILKPGIATLRHRGEVPLARSKRLIEVWEQGGLLQIDVDGLPSCQIELDNLHIELMGALSFDSDLGIELVTGPALVLLLSQQSIYCLHAGCVKTPVGVIGFLAESGVGKSTLSRGVDQNWQQLADDILPIATPERVRTVKILTDFPQLKLPKSHVGEKSSGTQLLDVFLRLTSQPSHSIEFRIYERREALLEIVRHTVAAKLFDEDTLRKHIRFARSLSMMVPMVQISYPRDISMLDELRTEIRHYIGGLLNRSS